MLNLVFTHYIYHYCTTQKFLKISTDYSFYELQFRATRLEYTNALLIAIDISENAPECGVSSNLPSIMPQRVMEVDPCSYQDRFRERPPTCLMGNSTVSKQ